MGLPKKHKICNSCHFLTDQSNSTISLNCLLIQYNEYAQNIEGRVVELFKKYCFWELIGTQDENILDDDDFLGPDVVAYLTSLYIKVWDSGPKHKMEIERLFSRRYAGRHAVVDVDRR